MGHISDQLLWKFKAHPERLELDGELYLHGMSLQEIHSIVSREVNFHEKSSHIHLNIFDIIEDRQQAIRTYHLNDLNIDLPHVDLVPSKIIPATEEDIFSLMREYIYHDYEGIIIRHPFAPYMRKRSTYVMKFKPRKSDTYKIVGFQEEIDKDGYPKGSLGALLLNSDVDQVFGVGTGFTRDQRKQLWIIRESLLGSYAKINYQRLTPKGIPFHSVFCEILEENDETP
jgi:ATP-dependent DNA ligase